MVTDIETTLEKQIAFDVAWKGIDRKGREYCRGSYLILEAFKYDVPYFKEKLGHYFSDTYSHLVEPLPMQSIKQLYNSDVRLLQDEGHRVIFAAYNGGFDARHLGKTCNYILGDKFLDYPLELLCLWNYWALSCPMNYTAKASPSGKYLSTKAEDVFTFEFNQPDFIERHIAWSDVEIECDILLKTLARKKKIPVTRNVKEISARPPWIIANERAGVPVDYQEKPAANSHGLI